MVWFFFISLVFKIFFVKIETELPSSFPQKKKNEAKPVHIKRFSLGSFLPAQHGFSRKSLGQLSWMSCAELLLGLLAAGLYLCQGAVDPCWV